MFIIQQGCYRIVRKFVKLQVQNLKLLNKTSIVENRKAQLALVLSNKPCGEICWVILLSHVPPGKLLCGTLKDENGGLEKYPLRIKKCSGCNFIIQANRFW
jgi:hypothetical protein